MEKKDKQAFHYQFM